MTAEDEIIIGLAIRERREIGFSVGSDSYYGRPTEMVDDALTVILRGELGARPRRSRYARAAVRAVRFAS